MALGLLNVRFAMSVALIAKFGFPGGEDGNMHFSVAVAAHAEDPEVKAGLDEMQLAIMGSVPKLQLGGVAPEMDYVENLRSARGPGPAP